MTRMLDAVPSSQSLPHPCPAPVDPRSYFRGRFGDIAAAKIIKGFILDPQWKPARGETRAGYVNVPALVASTPGAEFEFRFTGTAAGLMITSGYDAGTIEFSVDGKPYRQLNTRTQWSNSLHLPWALILDDELPNGKHTVRVRVVSGALRVFHLLLN